MGRRFFISTMSMSTRVGRRTEKGCHVELRRNTRGGLSLCFALRAPFDDAQGDTHTAFQCLLRSK